jgi:hypothetical protein
MGKMNQIPLLFRVSRWMEVLRKRRLFWIGSLAGGLIGMTGGIGGTAIGILMGYFLQELIGQFFTDTAVGRYLENPGPSVFYEGEPGLAAYCGLGIYLMFQSGYRDEELAEPVIESALSAFPRGRRIIPLIELFCRIAASRRVFLNPDLLAESLAARRKSRGDSAVLGEKLEFLALGKNARREAAYIRSTLDPSYEPSYSFEEIPENIPDPWLVMGLPPGSAVETVKSAFRRLAVRFHPDMLQGLEEAQRRAAVQQFITIKEAYRLIMRSNSPSRRI